MGCPVQVSSSDRWLRLVAVSGLAIGLAGCSSVRTNYELKVNASANPATKPVASYRLQTNAKTVDVNTLRYKEAEGQVKAALSGKGMYEAPQPEKADIVIDLDYGISAPLLKEELVTTITTDQFGNIRERQDTVLVTIYEKHVNMTAKENRERADSGPARTLWGVEVINEDGSKDLRKYLPIMIGASIEYMGRETGEVQTIRVSENDSSIDFVRKGL